MYLAADSSIPLSPSKQTRTVESHMHALTNSSRALRMNGECSNSKLPLLPRPYTTPHSVRYGALSTTASPSLCTHISSDIPHATPNTLKTPTLQCVYPTSELASTAAQLLAHSFALLIPSPPSITLVYCLILHRVSSVSLTRVQDFVMLRSSSRSSMRRSHLANALHRAIRRTISLVSLEISRP